MLRRFCRHIKEGFQGFGRHFGLSFSSSTAVTITLIIIGVFVVLTYNLQKMTLTIENSISISALVAYDAEDDNNIKRIEKELKEIDGISSVTYSSKEDEFNYYINSADEELRKFYEAYRNDNPFHDAFILNVADTKNLNEILKKVSNIYGISEVYDGGSNTYKLIDVLEKTRLFGGVLALSLIFLAVYLVYNTIKVAISSRKDEIWIMRNVGAKNSYVRAPFLVEGILIGALGSLIPILVLSISYIYLYNNLNGNLFGAFVLETPMPFVLYLSLGLFLGGILVGLIGSYISVCKFLRVRRWKSY